MQGATNTTGEQGAAADDAEYLEFKIALVGDVNTGKTSLALRASAGQFNARSANDRCKQTAPGSTSASFLQ
jgi:GTPase SAR1 family protein